MCRSLHLNNQILFTTPHKPFKNPSKKKLQLLLTVKRILTQQKKLLRVEKILPERSIKEQKQFINSIRLDWSGWSTSAILFIKATKGPKILHPNCSKTIYKRTNSYHNKKKTKHDKVMRQFEHDHKGQETHSKKKLRKVHTYQNHWQRCQQFCKYYYSRKMSTIFER